MAWEDIKNWIVENIQVLAGAVAVFMVALLIAGGVAEYRKHREQAAVESLFRARQEIAGLSPDRQRSDGPGIYRQVIEKHGGSRAAFEALVSIGDLYNESKNLGEAAKTFAEAAKSAPDEFAKVLALYNKGSAEEMSGNCDAAIETYTSVAKLGAAKFLVPEVLLAEGRCHEQKKNYTEASSVYQKIQNEFPNNSYYTGAAQVFLDKLRPYLKN